MTVNRDHIPEVIRTFQVIRIRMCSTDRSRSRRRHGPVGPKSTIDDGFLADEESPNFEHMVQPRTVADNVNRTVRNRNNTRGRWSGPEVKITLAVMKIIICSTNRSRNRRRQEPVLKQTTSV